MLYEYECKRHGEFYISCPVKDYKAVASCPVCDKASARKWSAPYVKFPPCKGFTNSVHEKDIKARYVRPDGSVGRERDKFYEATRKDEGRG